MIDYKKLLELKKRGLSGHAIAKTLGCKWDTVQRIVSRCENYWGDLESVPESLSNADIADAIFVKRFKADEDYLQPDCELILEKQRHGKLRNELWIEYSAEAVRRGKKAYKISQFNSIVSAFRTSNDISFSVTHDPEWKHRWTGVGTPAVSLIREEADRRKYMCLSVPSRTADISTQKVFLI